MPLRLRRLDDGRLAVSVVSDEGVSDRDGLFSRGAVVGLLTVAIGTFGLLVVLDAYAPEWRGDERGGGNALSRSAVGFAGIVELLRGLGVPVSVSREAHRREPCTRSLC